MPYPGHFIIMAETEGFRSHAHLSGVPCLRGIRYALTARCLSRRIIVNPLYRVFRIPRASIIIKSPSGIL